MIWTRKRPGDGSDKVVPLDIGFQSDTGAPSPILLDSDDATFLLFRATSGIGVIEFDLCRISKFGYPNDEALAGHPLYKNGLRSYGAFEVLESSWVRQITEQNRVSFPKTAEDLTSRHFIFTLHDSTFECIAKGFQAHLHTCTYDEVFRQIAEKIRLLD